MPVNEASSSEGSAAPVLLEQRGEPWRHRWGKAATVTVVPDSSQSSLMTPVGNTEFARTEQEGDNKEKERREGEVN